jgi:beta-mannosidase
MYLFTTGPVPCHDAIALITTLLPGERRALRLHGIPAGREAELLTAPVLRTANDLVLGLRKLARVGDSA